MILIDIPAGLDPYTHAAMEDYAVRHLDCTLSDYVILYTNSPCVVVGKNQSIYKEVNMNYLRDPANVVVRRISGGGTVYHDEGNLCFAFVSQYADSKVNNYRYFNQCIVDVLKKVGLEVYFSPRNDLMLADKKISGNAQFTNRKNILSHGTLLVHADMDRLRAALHQNEFEVQTKAVSSVRSSVLNLSDVSAALPSVSHLKRLLLQYLPIEHTRTLHASEWDEVALLREQKYAHRDWTYGRNPTTAIVKNQLTILVEHGRITSIHQGGDAMYLELSGAEYSTSGLLQAGISNQEMGVLF